MELRVAQALWTLGIVTNEKLSEVALESMIAGVESTSLCLLSGLTDSDRAEAPRLFAKALIEIGLSPISRQDAARIYAKWVSQQIVAGDISPEKGARMLWEASVLVNDPAFHDLDSFIYAASELESRPDERELFVREIVREAREWVQA